MMRRMKKRTPDKAARTAMMMSECGRILSTTATDNWSDPGEAVVSVGSKEDDVEESAVSVTLTMAEATVVLLSDMVRAWGGGRMPRVYDAEGLPVASVEDEGGSRDDSKGWGDVVFQERLHGYLS